MHTQHMWVLLATVVVLGVVVAWIVGDAIVAVARERREMNARIRAQADEMIARHRARTQGRDQ